MSLHLKSETDYRSFLPTSIDNLLSLFTCSFPITLRRNAASSKTLVYPEWPKDWTRCRSSDGLDSFPFHFIFQRDPCRIDEVSVFIRMPKKVIYATAILDPEIAVRASNLDRPLRHTTWDREHPAFSENSAHINGIESFWG